MQQSTLIFFSSGNKAASYGVYISQLIGFARSSNQVSEIDNWNKILTYKLIKQGFRYPKLLKTFSKIYRRNSELMFKYNNVLKTLLQKGLSDSKLYGDLVYKCGKIVGKSDCSVQF